MDRKELDLTSEEVTHAKLMRAIARSVNDTPLVLKGGTALMFGYGLDRFSEDLDFDAPHKLNLDSRIRRVAPAGTSITDIATIKNTETMTRYRVNYTSKDVPGKLKIEVSYRTAVAEQDVRLMDGIRLLSLPKLIDQKLSAAFDGDNPRTAIRDLYDLDFIVRNHRGAISQAQANRLRAFASDPERLVSQYRDAYQFDDLVRSRVSLDDLALNLCGMVDELGKSVGPEIDAKNMTVEQQIELFAETMEKQGLVFRQTKTGGDYIGKILHIGDKIIGQTLGKGVVTAHDRTKLDGSYTVGQTCDIQYRDGRGIDKLQEPQRQRDRDDGLSR